MLYITVGLAYHVTNFFASEVIFPSSPFINVLANVLISHPYTFHVFLYSNLSDAVCIHILIYIIVVICILAFKITV